MDPQYREPGLEALARRAEQKQDAEALVFVAVRHWEASERVRLAEEAVRLDQNLTWVYAMVYACSPRPSELDQRVQKLERWDPQNALPYLITAECIDIDQVVREKIPQRAEDERCNALWMSARSRGPILLSNL
jgi:formylmethanofuran dehydrogenase subunit E